GLVWATAILVNIYASMLTFVTILPMDPLTVAQSTVLMSMILVAHNLPVELRICQKAGTRLRFMFLFRMGGALFFGWILFRLYQWGGWLQQPNLISWMPKASDPSLQAWIFTQAKQLVMVFVIIFAMLLIMKLLERAGITALMVRILDPVLRLLGIGPSASPITIIGITLGLGYGGGLIINEAVSGRIEKRDVLFSLSLMGLCHSLFEDTLAVGVFGGDLSGIFWGRMIFSLLVVFLLVRLLSGISDRVLNMLFVRTPAE
ncbi:MAG: hypothetical protein LLG06_17225, partial [Desulfobacteraceae bacterium]|nr:hypothetical protein [Desulfobacteraceae bacterium]